MTRRTVHWLLAGFAAVAATVVGTPLASATATHAPYQDAQSVGYIGLCDKAGQQITQGSVSTTPLAYRAVSSVAAQAPYNAAGRTAILLAYQPREGIDPGEWSGDELTASSRYTNVQHPMTAATGGDDSLADFTSDFHPMWDGFIQLRMYLGAPDQQPYSYHYPSLNLQITGNTWHAVGGGPVSCSSGKSESIETILLKPTKSAAPTTPGSGNKHTNSSTGTSKNHPSDPPTTATAGPTTTQAATNSASSSTSSSSDHRGLIVAIVLAVLLLATGLPLLIRRRRGSSTSTP